MPFYILENVRKKITQCTAIQTAMALALIRLGKISGRRRPGTGPAPRANVKTNLHERSIKCSYYSSVFPNDPAYTQRLK